jgi:polysaccharide export outer membrane protein
MRKLLYLFGLLLFFSSCGWLNPSIMLTTGKDYKYAKTPDSSRVSEYKISPNDILEFNLYSNDGFKLIDLTSLNTANSTYRMTSELAYLVETDGNVKLPIIGRKKLSGLTIREAELMLEDCYSAFYVKPFVLMTITNKRVIVFPGSPGDAKTIPLLNNNTTLLEAIALAGGISEDGKAKQVKLIRQNKDKYDVFLIDLSKIEGLNQANMVLQANDIIYVEPRRKYSSKFIGEMAPIISILSSAFIVFTYIKILKK